MRFGTPEQRQRFLPPMARGQVIWCQGFSEPDAGSDLASLRTSAADHGDHFVVNGQKIWTSYADAPADWCLLLVRTNREVPKHRGISVLLLDMRTPGITVRPIDTMAGPHEFNELFFDDVVVPRDCLLGEQDRGWDVIVEGLTFERAGIARYARAGRVIELLVEWARSTGRARDLDVRRKLADLRVRYEAARLLSYRVVSLQAAGELPTTEASIARIQNGQLEQLVGQVGLELLGPSAQLEPSDEWSALAGEVHRYWTRNIPTTIAAGTLEVQKNIVAQRGLGLPRPE
jgi:alkylation response protein AidB-like acyl-CoA dehydrogenase